MREYYDQLVIAGRPRLTAMQDAMRTLRKVKQHPFYWAPFIGIGKDAPLTIEAKH